MPKVEMKRWIAFYDENAVSTLTGLDPRPLTDIDQGTGAYQRIGNEIQAKAIYFRGIMHNNAAITNCVRMAILGTNGDADITIATGEFFKDSNLAGGATGTFGGAAGLNSMYYPINTAKFDVYYDRVFKLSAVSVDSNDTMQFRKFIRLNRKIKYEATTSGLNNQNYRYLMVVWTAEGGDDVGVGTVVEFSAQTHFYYTDC